MYTPFKMKGKSPMMKALIGKQSRLPEHLKAKILAAPESPAKMKRKSPVKDGRKHDHPHDRINGVPGSGLEGMGKDGRPMKKKSPAKATSKAAKNLLKAVPNKKAYEKLSDIDKKGFDKAAKKAGLPTKSAAKMKKSAMKLSKRTYSKVKKGVKKVVGGVKDMVKTAVDSKALTTGFSRTSKKVSDARKKASKKRSRMSSGGGASR